MQGPSGEPATRQYPVDRGNAERQDSMDRQRRPLDPPDALAKLRKACSLLDHVLFLFSLLLFVNGKSRLAGHTAMPRLHLTWFRRRAHAFPVNIGLGFIATFWENAMSGNGHLSPAQVHAKVKHPIIDGDGHWVEFPPVFAEKMRRSAATRRPTAFSHRGVPASRSR